MKLFILTWLLFATNFSFAKSVGLELGSYKTEDSCTLDISKRAGGKKGYQIAFANVHNKNRKHGITLSQNLKTPYGISMLCNEVFDDVPSLVVRRKLPFGASEFNYECKDEARTYALNFQLRINKEGHPLSFKYVEMFNQESKKSAERYVLDVAYECDFFSKEK